MNYFARLISGTIAYAALTFVWHIQHSFAHSMVHDEASNARYLGNEALLVTHADKKVLFDPFFHNDFGHYQKVPEVLRAKMFEGAAPFDGVDMVVISHAHEDHFSAHDVHRYLTKHPKVVLVAPAQAIAEILPLTSSSDIKARLHAVELAFGDMAYRKQIEGVDITAVRIPHAGWPSRAEVQNLVFRLSFEPSVTVIHMGDADPAVEHYTPYKPLWEEQVTQLGFPPYWFLTSAEGRYILNQVMLIERTVGVHVPVNVPELLIRSGQDYFSEPGQVRALLHPPESQ